jgi:hypothetical protein
MKDNLHEEILRQLSLINFDRSKTIIENREIVLSESEWCKSKEAASVKKQLYEQGFFTIPKTYYSWDCPKDLNDAYSKAAMSGIKYLTDTLFTYIEYPTLHPYLKINVLSNGSGGEQKFNSFNDEMVSKLRGELVGSDDMGKLKIEKEVKSSRKIYNTFVLKDFYFNYGKLLNSPYLFEGGPWNFINMFFGENPGQAGSTVYIQKTISSIKEVNRYKQPTLSKDVVGGVDDVWKVDNDYTEEMSEMIGNTVAALHEILPVASLILTFSPIPGGFLAGSALELIDAGLYMFYDDDPYMATITFIFAVVQLHEISSLPGFEKMVKTYGSETKAMNGLFRKLKGGQPLLESEQMFLEGVITSNKINNKFIGDSLKRTIKVIVESKSVNFIVKLVNNLALDLGLGNSLMRNLYMIWGSTYAFDYWAYNNLGACSATFNFDELTSLIGVKTNKIPKDVQGIQRRINELKNKLIKDLNPQPFTNSPRECELLAQIKLLEEYKKIKQQEKELFHQSVIMSLKELKNKNAIMSLKPNDFQKEVAFVQLALSSCGFLPYMGITYKITNFFDKKGKKVSNYNHPDSGIVQNLLSKIAPDWKNYSGSIITFENVGNVESIELIRPPYRTETLKPKRKEKISSSKIDNLTHFQIQVKYIGGGTVLSDFIVQDTSGKVETVFKGGIDRPGGISKRINWGYFDELTDIMLEAYQNQRGLSVTRKVDSQTYEKLIEDLENKKCGILRNFTGLDLTDIEEMAIQQKAVDNLIENWQYTSPPEPIQLTNQQKQDSIKVINHYIEGLDKLKKLRAVNTINNLESESN